MTDFIVSLHGPNVTVGDADEPAQALVALLDLMAEQTGSPTGWRVGRIEFRCDGCDLRLPDRPPAGSGWTYADGDDFCPACSESRVSH